MSAGRGPATASRADRAPGAGQRSKRPVPPALPGPLRPFMAALFSAALLLPRLRAWRRTRAWSFGRAVVAAGAAGCATVTEDWWRCGAVGLALAALALRRTADPDRERRLQAAQGADYFLNGGEWAGSGAGPAWLSLGIGDPLWVLVRGDHLLLAPRKGRGIARVALRAAAIDRILVDGRDYRPVYVSEAKQPPVRATEVDRHAVAELALMLRSGRALRFLYRGAFARHLAETAAHAIFSARGAACEGR